MVNPVKFLGRATGISNLLDKPTPAPAPTASPTAQPPAPPPLVGAESAPKRPAGGRQFAPSIIGTAAAYAQPTGQKTLLGQ